jgi:hypothetical protein
VADGTRERSGSGQARLRSHRGEQGQEMGRAGGGGAEGGPVRPVSGPRAGQDDSQKDVKKVNTQRKSLMLRFLTCVMIV